MYVKKAVDEKSKTVNRRGFKYLKKNQTTDNALNYKVIVTFFTNTTNTVKTN